MRVFARWLFHVRAASWYQLQEYWEYRLFTPFPLSFFGKKSWRSAGEEDGLLRDVADERGDLLHAPIEARVAHAVGDRGRVLGQSLRVQVSDK